MMNESCKIKRILALLLAIATLLCCAPALAESYDAITASASLTVYADAALSKKAGVLEGYAIVSVSAVQGDVAKIQYGKKSFFVDAGSLVAVEDLAIPATVRQNTRVFEAPDLDSRSAAMKKGLQLNVLYINGDWAMVEKDGNLGYAYVEHLEPASTQPDEGDDPFLPDEEEGGTTDDSDSSVTIETIAARVSASALPVYKSARTSSKKLGTLPQGQAVTIYAYNADWAYIGLEGRYGFCALSGLQKDSGEQPDDGADDSETSVPVTVTAARVKVYKSASTSSKSLGTLRKGAEVNLVKARENWAYIELNGKYGYCALDALTKTSDLTPDDGESGGEVIGNKEPLGTATVIQATAPVYDSMKASEPKSSLKLGETVSFYGYDSKWVLIGKDGKFGFVLRQYLSADSYAELEAEDSGAAVQDLESALLSLGYLDGVPSVNYTSLTTAAVKRLQAACGMSESGNANLATLRVLYSGNAPLSPMLSVSLSSGTKNENVTRLQTRLHALGYLSRSSSIDGDYGSTTSAAVRLFQKAADVSATGTADNKTIRALYSASAPKLASGTDAADATSGGNSGGGSSGNTTGMPPALVSTTSKYDSSMSNAEKLEHVIYVAQQQLGKRYVFGSAGTATFDCSGLTMYCFKQVGVSLRHSAYSEGYNDNHKKISDKSSLRRGDLVFFNTISDGDQCDHLGIYLGSSYFIHASSGAGKVVVSNMSSGYYSRVYSWGRRVL